MVSGLYDEEGVNAHGREYAELLDSRDPLRNFRREFIIPSKKDLKRRTLAADESAYVLWAF